MSLRFSAAPWSKLHQCTYMYASIYTVFLQPLSQTAMCYVTGIKQLASQSVTKLCLGYICGKDDLSFISFHFISLDLSRVAVVLVLCICMYAHVSLSSVLIQSLTLVLVYVGDLFGSLGDFFVHFVRLDLWYLLCGLILNAQIHPHIQYVWVKSVYLDSVVLYWKNRDI